MFGRADFPMMDDVVTVSLLLHIGASAAGQTWKGIIPLCEPLQFDNRPGQWARFATLKNPRFYGHPGILVQLLANDIAPNGGAIDDPMQGASDNPRENVLYTAQILVTIAPYVKGVRNQRLVLLGEEPAPEARLDATQPGVLNEEPVPFSITTLVGMEIYTQWDRVY